METDVLIIGCGIAGATAALRLAEDKNRQITIIVRSGKLIDSNSALAQGGIVSRGDNDSVNILTKDILEAGDGLNNQTAVKVLAEEGPNLVDSVLINQLGVKFDQSENGKQIFGLEAAHSKRRILHVGDKTGLAIMLKLLKAISGKKNITILSSHTVVDLLTFPHHSVDPKAVYDSPKCYGAYVYNQKNKKVTPFLAKSTILATGGIGQIFLNTTNNSSARGDGVAMAYRAGARVANMEYIQFHPTSFYMHGSTKFLISEAVRGEGGVLLTKSLKPFMKRYAPKWKDLAPRDVVARAVYWEMLTSGDPYVLLDIASHKKASFIKKRFPQIYAKCLEHDIDITKEPIPVVPATHYFCGGVLVDTWGKTTLSGLYAVGEVSCTGLHGANRLASTSLLEGLVWGNRVAEKIKSNKVSKSITNKSVPDWNSSGLIHKADPALIERDIQTIRNLMWHYVGLVRNEYRLRRAVRELQHLWMEIEDFYRKTRLTDSLLGLRNSVQVALLVARASLRNTKSRGCHYRE